MITYTFRFEKDGFLAKSTKNERKLPEKYQKGWK
jgi:hypothetical protein